ncbi:Pentatricopeptide repeat-containing protein [Nymphaea thermarum]|nr:Pentatricopeptide repeat-containing protein [Nymphaea thermarum]
MGNEARLLHSFRTKFLSTSNPKALYCRIHESPFNFCFRSSLCSSTTRPLILPMYSSLKRPIKHPPAKTPQNPTIDMSELKRSISQLPPRFTAQDLTRALYLQSDPLVCLHLFNWASQQPRFKHDVCTYHVTIKKLGSFKLYDRMDALADQVLANSCFHSEPVFTTIIYFYCEGRKLSKAVRVFKHMKNSKRLGCRPSLRTYNLLFNAMLSKGSNSYISHMYMQTMRCLFRQMVDDGVRPDIFTLNFMVRGYVSSMHLNDALRIFHQMEVIYSCQPNAYTYDHLIHGLCAQGRSINAKTLYREMVSRGHTPSAKAYNSLVNCLAICGEVDDAVRFMKEMIEKVVPILEITT